MPPPTPGVAECSVCLGSLVSIAPDLPFGVVGWGARSRELQAHSAPEQGLLPTVHLHNAQDSSGTDTLPRGIACPSSMGDMRLEQRGEEQRNGVQSPAANLPHSPLAFNISPGPREIRPNAP